MEQSAEVVADPTILLVLSVAFVIGALVPFAWCILGAIRDERALRRAAEAGTGGASDAALPPAPAEKALPGPEARETGRPLLVGADGRDVLAAAREGDTVTVLRAASAG